MLQVPGLDPGSDVGVPAQVPGIDVEDAGSAEGQVTSYIIIFRLLFTEKSLICLQVKPMTPLRERYA